jgi:ABC-type dipeptide/oligopeptide/nickel transport system ATPase component
MTMMLVTHEMGFASEIADRVLMFDHGKILEDGPPSKIFKQPGHDRTKSFLKPCSSTDAADDGCRSCRSRRRSTTPPRQGRPRWIAAASNC